MNFVKLFMTGLKLALVLALGFLIMFLPNILLTASVVVLPPQTVFPLAIAAMVVGLTLNGWLLIKYHRWILK